MLLIFVYNFSDLKLTNMLKPISSPKKRKRATSCAVGGTRLWTSGNRWVNHLRDNENSYLLFCSSKLIETRADGALAEPLPADLNTLHLDRGRGDCVHGYNGGNRKGDWGDYGCENEIPFVCEGHSPS